jgi:peptidoglycan/LPS O-acetylase OafA/YrhL
MRRWYIPELDGLRCFAVLFVMLHHFHDDSRWFMRLFHQGGWIGVDIFFTLSGFLITGLLMREYQSTGTVNLKYFWARRFLRLWPAWMVCIFAASMLTWVLAVKNPQVWQSFENQIWAYLLFAANYSKILHGDISKFFGHLWSLAVEEHFYFIWPFVFLLFFRRRKRLFFVSVVLTVIPLVMRFAHVSYSPDTSMAWMHFATECRFDSILMGCVLALVIDQLPKIEKRTQLLLTIAGIILWTPAFIKPDFQQSYWYVLRAVTFTTVSLGSCLLIWSAVEGSENFFLRRLLRHPAALWTGQRSYDIYLVHLPVLACVFVLEREVTNRYGPVPHFSIVLGISFSLLLGALLYNWISRRFETARARFRVKYPFPSAQAGSDNAYLL